MAAAEALPPEVRRLALTSIPSVPFLEALLLLHRSLPQPIGAAEIARRLYVGEAAARHLLETIVAAGFGVSGVSGVSGGESTEASFRFDDRDAERTELVAELARCWTRHLVEITHLIHDNTQRKGVRFADAFKLRKDS